MLARDIQSNQMSLTVRSGPDSFPNGNYQDSPLPHLNSNVYDGYTVQTGYGVSNVQGNNCPGSVFRKPIDNKTLGSSTRTLPCNVYNNQAPVTYSPMWTHDRDQNSSYFPAQASGPWTQHMSFYDNPFKTAASLLSSSGKPASVSEQPRLVLHESQSIVKQSIGNYRYVDNSGHFFNSTYNSGNLASHKIPYPCTSKQYSYTVSSTDLETPICCPEPYHVPYSNPNTSTREEGTSHYTNETQKNNHQRPFYRNGEDVIDPHDETMEEIQKISDIIWNELKDDTVGVESPENCKSQTTLKYGPLLSKRFSAFRHLVKQFYQDSRHKAKNDERCANRDRTSIRNSRLVNEVFNATNERRWSTEPKPELNEDANRNDRTQSSEKKDSTEKNIIRSLVCSDLKVKDHLVYLKFPFYSVEGEQLRPFLKRCLKLNNQTTSADQIDLKASGSPDTSNLFHSDPSYLSEPLDYQDITKTLNLRNCSAFISEFSFEDLKQTISCIAKSYVEHLDKPSAKLSTEKKQWILDVYSDVCRLREKIFGPLLSVKAELQHEIFYATGINVDFSRNVMSQYSSRIYKRLPGAVKFFSSIPGFKELNFDDKKTLISESLLENWFLGWFNNLDDENSIIIDTDHQILLSVAVLKDSFPAEHSFIKSCVALAGRLNKLELTPEEVIILRAVVLLWPARAGLKEPGCLVSISRKYRECLRFLLCQNHEESEKIMSEIDATFLQFRSISGQYRDDRCKEFISDITQDSDLLAQICACKNE